MKSLEEICNNIVVEIKAEEQFRLIKEWGKIIEKRFFSSNEEEDLPPEEER